LDKNSRIKSKLYQVEIYTPGINRGILYETFGSEISFINKYNVKDESLTNLKTKVSKGDIKPSKIPVNTIRKIKIKKRFTGEGIAIGVATGLIAGVLIGASQEDDFLFTTEQYGAMYGAGLAICGGILGGIIGSTIQIQIPINGDIKKYHKKRTRIRKYSVTGR